MIICNSKICKSITLALCFPAALILFNYEYSLLLHHKKSVHQVKIPSCECYKDTLMSQEERNSLNSSSCSTGILRGRGQKVFAYSFYDDPKTSDTLNRNFFNGIVQNLRGIDEHYNKGPEDWNGGQPFTMRLYFQLHHKSKNRGKLCEIACSEPLLDICEIPHSNKLFPMLWRYFPVADLEVDQFFSRDLDSRITTREVKAVHEFFSSNKSIHVMRDHMQHGVEILGGMWDAKLVDPSARSSIHDALFKMLGDPIAFKPRTESQHDQSLLAKYMWPLVGKMGLSHDSYHCERFRNSKPFPTQRSNSILNFVGAVADINHTISFNSGNECPMKCRPKEHKDWSFC